MSVTNDQAREALDRILNFCEEIDHHIAPDEQTGYKMFPDWKIVSDYLNEADALIDDLQRDTIPKLKNGLERANAMGREADAEIANYILQIAEMQKQIATQDSELMALMQYKKIEADKDAEIERLNGVIETMEDNCMTCDYKIVDRVSTARAEAITEFAERLKKYYDALKSGLVSYHIDQIAKEMREKV